MKKNYCSWMTIIMMAFVCISITSCGSDDDDVSVKVQLIGLWKTSMGSSNWKYIKLDSDGVMYYGSNAENIDREVSVEMSPVVNGNTPETKVTVGEKKSPYAHWSYNEKEQTISMYRDDGYYAFTYKVTMAVDGNSWAGYDSASGKTYAFTRTSTD